MSAAGAMLIGLVIARLHWRLGEKVWSSIYLGAVGCGAALALAEWLS